MTRREDRTRLQRWVQKRFFPDLVQDSAEAVDYEYLASRGFRLVLLDIDNTLALHGSREADAYARRVVEKIQQAGLVPVITSNALEERARSFAESLGLDYIAQAKKPSIDAICRELDRRDCLPGQTLMVGDQLLTDVWSARRAGIPVILTRKRSREELLTVRIKRPIERLLVCLGGKEAWARLQGGDRHDRL